MVKDVSVVNFGESEAEEDYRSVGAVMKVLSEKKPLSGKLQAPSSQAPEKYQTSIV